jgi:hypothetical protein
MQLFRIPSRTYWAWLTATTLVMASARAEESAPTSTDDRPTQTAPPAVSEQKPERTTAEASNASQSPVPTSAEIAAWIVDLEDNRYLVREQATRHLLDAGLPAVDALLEAVNGKGLERSDRALWVLRRFSGAKDATLRRQALERLVLVRDRPRVAAAASQALAVMRHQEAVASIERLGGRFSSSQLTGGQTMTAPFATPLVVLDNQWRGGDAGLAHLADLLGLQRVVIVGTDISMTGIEELQEVSQLKELWMYGTQLEWEDIAKMQEMLPQVHLDYRRGGLLGVGGAQNAMGPAVVSHVQKGSAAEKAGIKAGDIIRRFNDQTVGSFKQLTAKIGELRAGEEIKLDVLRDGKSIEITAKLGQWQTY